MKKSTFAQRHGNLEEEDGSSMMMEGVVQVGAAGTADVKQSATTLLGSQKDAAKSPGPNTMIAVDKYNKLS